MIAIALWLLGFVSGLFTLIALACAKVSGLFPHRRRIHQLNAAAGFIPSRCCHKKQIANNKTSDAIMLWRSDITLRLAQKIAE